MRTSVLLLALLALPLWADDDDSAKVLAEQKAAAEAGWKALDVGEMATHETEHLRVVGPKEMEGKLKAVGASVERYHALALKTLAIPPKEAHPGKITVYLLPSTANYPTFARMVEKRRPEAGETGSFDATDARLHAAAAPGKGGTPADVKAGEMVAALLLARKAGVRTPLPDWLPSGFGRATTYRLSPKDKAVAAERKQARLIGRRKSAADVWDAKVEAEEAGPMNAALAEFLAYGPGAARFPKFVQGYKPVEDMESRSTADALDAIDQTGEGINKRFKEWLAK